MGTMEMPAPATARKRRKKPAGEKAMIGGMFDREVRRALAYLALHPDNEGRSLQDLLGEAINDLLVKYGQSPVYRADE